jgi:hypothetical protein
VVNSIYRRIEIFSLMIEEGVELRKGKRGGDEFVLI